MNARFFLASGLVFALLAVMLGAFGAHALRASISAQQMQTWQTASEYHFYHALGLIALGIWMENKASSLPAKLSGVLLIVGLVLFSGSLYLMVMTSTSTLGMITPIGGLCLMAGWLSWFAALITQRHTKKVPD
jgi:uncharacterized membrane protein YgdD (TMEM256/DUF423 family)